MLLDLIAVIVAFFIGSILYFAFVVFEWFIRKLEEERDWLRRNR